jgi:hypothetical protein
MVQAVKGESAMISQCVNPECGRPFKYLHDGKVFVVQQRNGVPSAQKVLLEKVSFLFLCSDCARTYTIIVRNSQPLVLPLKNENRNALRVEGGP